MTWMLSSLGRPLPLATPTITVANLSAAEVAHSLAQINRFCGHAVRPYSVAEHSLLVMRILDEQLGLNEHAQLAGLMHDAHECVVGDVTSPIKAELGAAWYTFEQQWEVALRRVYALTPAFEVYGRAIKRADLVALATERRDLLPSGGPDWPQLAGIEPWDKVDLRDQDGLSWQDWRTAWLDHYNALDFARMQPGQQASAAQPLWRAR